MTDNTRLDRARSAADQCAMARKKTHYVYAEQGGGVTVTVHQRTDTQAVYVAYVPDTAEQRKALGVRMRAAVHWLDDRKFPGGEVSCGTALTAPQFKTKVTREPAHVSCAMCLHEMDRALTGGDR